MIYIIDYGLAKSYKNPRTGAHILYKTNKYLTGTARYASINTHLGIEQSRRDDLEEIAYTLIYLLKGSLPWQGVHGKFLERKHNEIKTIKLSIDSNTLCKGCPTEFCTFLEYCRKLNFEDEPRYGFINGLFTSLFVKKGFNRDYMYDWVPIKANSQKTIKENKLLPEDTKNTEIIEEFIIDSETEDDVIQEVKECIIKPSINKVENSIYYSPESKFDEPIICSQRGYGSRRRFLIYKKT